MATLKQRKRKSSLLDFDSFEEYEKFAAKRNEATKRCRQKKDGELKVPFDIHSKYLMSRKAFGEVSCPRVQPCLLPHVW